MSTEGRAQSPEALEAEMRALGFKLNVTEVYHVYNPDTDVFRINGFVIKSRSAATPEQVRRLSREEENFNALMGFYETQGIFFPRATLTIADRKGLITMPYLGQSLHGMGSEVDMVRYNHGTGKEFKGFTESEIERLCFQLEHDLALFAGKSGLVHGDLIQNGEVNNLVYHPRLHRIFPVDAEAFTQRDAQSHQTYIQQAGLVRKWMHEVMKS